jgi:hypothetical protein
LVSALFAFFVIDMKTREVIHVGVTRSPTEQWMAQQLRNTKPFGIAGAELSQGSTAEIARSVEQLKDEINNIAQALEEVSAVGVSNSVKP